MAELGASKGPFEEKTTKEVSVRNKRSPWGEEKTALAEYDVKAVFAQAASEEDDDLEESTVTYPVGLDPISAFAEEEATSEISTSQLDALVKQRRMRRTEPPVDDDGLEVPTAAGKRGAPSWTAPTPALALGSDAIKPLGKANLPLATPAPELAGLDEVLDELGGGSQIEAVTDVDASAGLDAEEVERALGFDIAQRIAPREHAAEAGTPQALEPVVTDKVPMLARSQAKKKSISFTAALSACLLALVCGVGVFWGSAFVVMPEWFVSPYLLAPVSALASFILGALFVGRFMLVPPLLAAGTAAALIAVPEFALLAPLPFVLAGLATAAALMRVISLLGRR